MYVSPVCVLEHAGSMRKDADNDKYSQCLSCSEAYRIICFF